MNEPMAPTNALPELEEAGGPAPAPAGRGPIAVRVEGLSKKYRIGQVSGYKTLREGIVNTLTAPFRSRPAGGDRETEKANEIWALRDVSFEIHRGEVVGIIGRNGAGKSTLLKMLSRITEPTEGFAEIHGRVGSLLEVGTGFHRELTGRENIFLNGAILGMRHAEIAAKFDEIVAFAEMEKFLDTPVKHYSSGMYMRLAFAVAAHLEPEILLVDEVLAVGDAMFQKKCLGKMEDVARTGRTVLFVSHNMAAVRTLCTRGVVLHDGRVSEIGDIGRCIESYFRELGMFQVGTDGGLQGPKSFGFGRVAVNSQKGGLAMHAEPMEFETVLRLGQDAGGFTVTLTVKDVHDRVIFHTRQESPELSIAGVSKNDCYEIKVSVPPLFLNPGLYSAYFKVMVWGGKANSRHLSDKIPVDVTGAHGPDSALLSPPIEWEVSRRDLS